MAQEDVAQCERLPGGPAQDVERAGEPADGPAVDGSRLDARGAGDAAEEAERRRGD
jgi:hypothetical protein